MLLNVFMYLNIYKMIKYYYLTMENILIYSLFLTFTSLEEKSHKSRNTENKLLK